LNGLTGVFGAAVVDDRDHIRVQQSVGNDGAYGGCGAIRRDDATDD
jgi:hypothetical protein